MAKHRPRSTLVMGIAQENRQIRELQQEKQELQMALEEHQSALQLIMHKYRQHTVHLLHANRLDATIAQQQVKSKVRDSVCVCVCVNMRGSVCVFVCVSVRDSVCVNVNVRDSVCVCA